MLGSLGDTWRIIDNENARKVAALEEGGARRYQDFGELISGDRTKALAYVQGLHEEGMLSMGPAVGFARAVEPLQNTVLRLQRECMAASCQFQNLMSQAH